MKHSAGLKAAATRMIARQRTRSSCPSSWGRDCGSEMPQQPVLGIRRWPEVGNDQLVGIRRRQFAAGAIAQKMVEGGLNRLFYGIGSAVAHIGMLKFCVDDIDTVRLGLLRGRQHAGVGLEIRV